MTKTKIIMIFKNETFKQLNFSGNSAKYLTLKRPFFSAPLKASATIEAALIIPMFLIVAAVLLFGFGLLNIKLEIQDSLMVAVRSCAEYGEELSAISIGEFYSGLNMKRLNSMGASKELAYIEDESGNIFNMSVSYSAAEPIFHFPGTATNILQSAKFKYFTGYVLGSSPATNTDEDYIRLYMAENGTVYHVTNMCTYLHMEPKAISSSELEKMRNEDGAVYHACEKCEVPGEQPFVWITYYGEKYHDNPECSGLNRNYKEILVRKTDDIKYCSKCGGKNVD